MPDFIGISEIWDTDPKAVSSLREVSIKYSAIEAVLDVSESAHDKQVNTVIRVGRREYALRDKYAETMECLENFGRSQ